jgi:hypothetical protein
VTERASGHLRSRSWRALVATVLAALTTLLTAGMTTATAATFTYDVPTVARLDVHKVHIGEGPTALLSEARHGAASRLTWARGTSTTPYDPVVATEAGDTVQLFRHVDPAELQDIQSSGQFQLGPNTTGKYFAESADHAGQWGQMVNNGEGAIVETNVPRSVVDQLYGWDKLDGIGPARFVSPDQLDWFNRASDGIRIVRS